MKVGIRQAVETDATLLFELICEHAAHDGALSAVTNTEADLRREGFGPQPGFEALIIEVDGAPAGMALFFTIYSTWTGRRGLFLDDFFLRPACRGRGIGRALLQHLARLALDRGCRRIDLLALEHNPARRLYERVGFEELDVWRPYRLEGAALAALAAGESIESPTAAGPPDATGPAGRPTAARRIP
jgi:GNAT superfamily N-acetyltransferase